MHIKPLATIFGYHGIFYGNVMYTQNNNNKSHNRQMYNWNW